MDQIVISVHLTSHCANLTVVLGNASDHSEVGTDLHLFHYSCFQIYSFYDLLITNHNCKLLWADHMNLSHHSFKKESVYKKHNCK